MLHKVPKLLAAASGIFVVGVLVYTANERFSNSAFRGATTPTTSCTTWFYLDNPQNGGLPTPTPGVDDGSTTTTAAGMCGKKTKTIKKKYAPVKADGSARKVCQCGSNANTIKTALKNSVKALMDAECIASNGPMCDATCTKSGDATVKNKVGPTYTGESIDGGQRLCPGMTCYCFTSWKWSCDIEQACAGSSSSSSSVPPPPPSPPSSSSSSVTQVCCKTGTAYACSATCAAPGVTQGITGACNTATNCKSSTSSSPPSSSSSSCPSTAIGQACKAGNTPVYCPTGCRCLTSNGNVVYPGDPNSPYLSGSCQN